MEDINREIFELGRQIEREELLKTLEDKEDEIRYIRTSNWEEHANIITKQRDIWKDRAGHLWDLLKGIENLPFNYPYNEAKTIAQKRNEVYTPGLNWIKGMVKGETREEHWNLHKANRKIKQLERELQQSWNLLEEIENLPVNYPYCPSDEARRIAKKRHDICTIYKKRDKP